MEQINRRESRTNDHKAFWLAVTILAWMLVVVAALGLAAVVFEVIAFMYPWIQAR